MYLKVNGEKRKFKVLKTLVFNDEKVIIFHDEDQLGKDELKVYIGSKKENSISSMDSVNFVEITKELQKIMLGQDTNNVKFASLSKAEFNDCDLAKAQSFKANPKQLNRLETFEITEELNFNEPEEPKVEYEFDGPILTGIKGEAEEEPKVEYEFDGPILTGIKGEASAESFDDTADLAKLNQELMLENKKLKETIEQIMDLIKSVK